MGPVTPYGDLPCPLLSSRFLYAKAESLNDLISASSTSKAPGFWRSFSDEENERLLSAWQSLNDEARRRATKLRSSGLDTTRPIHEDLGVKEQGEEGDEERTSIENTISNPDYTLSDTQVPVGIDKLWTVDLLTLECISTFWAQPHVPVSYATWFLPPSQAGRYQIMDADVAEKVEAAFKQIGSWNPSYGDELSSAVTLGSDAELKLRVPLEGAELDVIFQGPDSARLYNRGVASSLSKSVLTTLLSRGQGHAGGQFILRGFDAVRNYEKLHLAKATARPATKDSRPASPAGDSGKSAPASSKATNRLSDLLKKSYSSASLQSEKSESTDIPDNPEDTAKTMETAGPLDADETPLSDLVLVIHGIGQKLAHKYTSFNFVHAVNQFRAMANKQCSEPGFIELARGKRIQFLPIRWRANLNLEEGLVGGPEENEERLRISDFEPDGIPFIREMVSSVLIDIPHYMSHQHRDRLIEAVVEDCNRVYRLFEQRNPGFNGRGKVHIIAHSLGSALTVDVLSRQPTHVPLLKEMTQAQLHSRTAFCFNASSCFFLGSPVGFFAFLNGAKLVARKSRARTKNSSPAVAHDGPRYGCLAVDSLYNVYFTTDPVAYNLNPAVDASYAKHKLKAAPVQAQTTSMLTSVSNSMSKLLEGVYFPKSLWPGAAAKPEPPAETKKPEAKIEEPESEADKLAKEKFFALNPLGNCDFFLDDESSIFSAYYSLFMAHANYWQDARVSAFILTQLFASPEQLAKATQLPDNETETSNNLSSTL